jgi:hypothetical protein
MPDEEYLRHVARTWNDCRPLLDLVTRESAPRYRIIPQREYSGSAGRTARGRRGLPDTRGLRDTMLNGTTASLPAPRSQRLVTCGPLLRGHLALGVGKGKGVA